MGNSSPRVFPIHLGPRCAETVTHVQVMHGADNDVLWLQRDYQAYLVNVLDTEKCCQVGHVLPLTLLIFITPHPANASYMPSIIDHPAHQQSGCNRPCSSIGSK